MEARNFMNRHKDLFVYLFIIGITFLVYGQVVNHEFLNFDDNLYVTDNDQVNKGISVEGITWAFSLHNKGYFHPLAYISHMIDCELFGMNAGMHHLMSLFIHIANALLLFFILRKMTDAFWKSAAVAVLFALHPVNVDSVAWLAERKNILSTFFWLLTMVAYFYYARTQRMSFYILAIFVYILGLLSKPMLITLPFVLLLMDYWPLNRIRIDARPTGKGWKESVIDPLLEQKELLKKLVSEKVPFFLLACVNAYVAMLSLERNPITEVSTKFVPMALRLENAPVSYFKYIYKMIWPSDLTFFYPYPISIPLWQVLLSLAGLIVITTVVFMALKKYPYLAVGWLWFIGTLVPVLGITQAGLWPAIGERWAYIPYIGLFVAIAWSLDDVISRLRYKRIIVAACMLILLGSFSYKTWLQAHYWKNNITLFTHGIDVDPNNYVSYSNLGSEYLSKKEYGKAIEYFQKTIKLLPAYPGAHFGLGVAYAEEGETDKAIEQYVLAVNYDPGHIAAYKNLRDLLFKQGKYAEAINFFTKVAHKKPDSCDVANILVEAMIKGAKTEDAIRFLTDFMKKNPKQKAFAYNNMGVVLKETGKTDEAIRYFSTALKLNSEYIPAHKNLMAVYESKGETQKVITELLQIIKLNPKDANSHYNLAVIYFKQGDKVSACRQFDEALKYDPKNKEYHYAYGVCLYNMERLDEAIAQFQEAVRLDKKFEKADKALAAAKSKRDNLGQAISQSEADLKRDPANISVMQKIAVLYKMKGDFDKALAYLQKMSQIQAGNPEVLYNIACVYAVQGKTGESLSYLQKALDKGFNNKSLMQTDKDLENIRGTEGYKKIVSRL